MRQSASKVPTSVRFSADDDARLVRVSHWSTLQVKQLIAVFVKLGLDRVEEAEKITIHKRRDVPPEEIEAVSQTLQSLLKAIEAESSKRGSSRRPQKGASTAQADSDAQQQVQARNRSSSSKDSSGRKKDSAA